MPNYKIIHFSGELKHEDTNLFTLVAEKSNAFWISDLTKDTIDSSQKINWTLRDNKGVIIAKMSKDGEWNKQYIINFSKKGSGKYTYTLDASFVEKNSGNIILVPAISLNGHCEAKLISISDNLPASIKTLPEGQDFQVEVEVEGLDGVELTCECEIGSGKAIEKITASKACVEGMAMFSLKLPIAFTQNSMPIEIKIKDEDGNYIKDGAKQEILLKKEIIIDPKSVETITNKTIATIAAASSPLQTEVNGVIELERVEVLDLDYHVCNDYIEDWTDKYKDLWILKDDPRGLNLDCHWLKKRDATNGDQTKPEVLPITMEKSQKFTFKAKFKCIVDVSNVIVKVEDPSGVCTFSINQPLGKMTRDTTDTLKFVADKPFGDIKFEDNFKLKFSYSFNPTDPNSWIPLTSVSFRLYITFGKPNITSFPNLEHYSTIPDSFFKAKKQDPAFWKPLYTENHKNRSLQFQHERKKYIFETLLYLGCKQCANKSLTEDEILESVFKVFKTKNVFRARENSTKNTRRGGGEYLPLYNYTEGMGYWRNESASPDLNNYRSFTTNSGVNTKAHYFEVPVNWVILPNPSPITDDDVSLFAYLHSFRSVRYMLAYGVARCGEWNRFLGYLLLVQGLPEVDNGSVAICSSHGFYETNNFLTYTERKPAKKWGFLAKYSENTHYSEAFAVKNAEQDSLTDSSHTINSSHGQGNPTAQPVFMDHIWFYYKNKIFYDPSYGEAFTEEESNLEEYCKRCLTTVYVQQAEIGPTRDPKTNVYTVSNKRKPSIRKKNIHNYIRSDKNVF